MGHIFTVASGFGIRIVPKAAPYRMRHGPGDRRLDVECERGGEWRFARISPDGIGGCISQLGENTNSLDDVLDVIEGPNWNAWWLETSTFRLPLPIAWTFHADGSAAPVLFDLIGPGGAAIYVQTPRRIPAPEALVAPGQTLRKSGGSGNDFWVEVAYNHYGERWFQRHTVVSLGKARCVVTIQAPEIEAASVLTAHQTVANEIEARSHRSASP